MSCYKVFLQCFGVFLAFEVSSLIIPVVSAPIEMPLPLRSIINKDRQLAPIDKAHLNTLTLSRSIRSTGSYSPFSSRRRAPRVLNRLMRPTLISETETSMGWNGSETVVEFKPFVTTFRNLTRAMLNLTVYNDSNLNKPVTLLASVTSIQSTGSSPIESVVTLGSLEPTPGQNTVAFDVLRFIQNITSTQPGVSSDGTVSFQKDQIGTFNSLKVRIVFQIRQQCNRVEGSDCPPILNILTRVPFLIFNYGNNLTELENIDELLSAMARRQLA